VLLFSLLFVRLRWIVKLFCKFFCLLFCRWGQQGVAVLFVRQNFYIALTTDYRLLYHQLFKQLCVNAPSLLRGCINVDFCSQLFTLSLIILLFQEPFVFFNSDWVVSVRILLIRCVRPLTLNWGIPWFDEFPGETWRLQITCWLKVSWWVASPIDQTRLVPVKWNRCFATFNLLTTFTSLHVDSLVLVTPERQLGASHFSSWLRYYLLQGDTILAIGVRCFIKYPSVSRNLFLPFCYYDSRVSSYFLPMQMG